MKTYHYLLIALAACILTWVAANYYYHRTDQIEAPELRKEISASQVRRGVAAAAAMRHEESAKKHRQNADIAVIAAQQTERAIRDSSARQGLFDVGSEFAAELQDSAQYSVDWDGLR